MSSTTIVAIIHGMLYFNRNMTSLTRLLLACGLFSAWLVLLFTGFVLGGGTHLLLAGSLYLFPWRMNRQGNGDDHGK